MAARIDPDMTFDDMESEVHYTRGALEADPDAADLMPTTDPWLGMIDAARAKDREVRALVARASARRRIANARLDAACSRFGGELYLAVGKNRDAARWKRFFVGLRGTISAFVRQPLRDQVAAVAAWLGVTGDDVLDRNREALNTSNTAASQALDLTASTATARGEVDVAREELADDLTRARDGLQALLTQRANEKGLDRQWPSYFFQIHRRNRRAPADATPPKDPTSGSDE